ncbi:ABC transporter ATP-binding protein [Oceanobacillus piezotolerans]|uniref:ABC transporter ATP-binding protein n=1 Tax=Oceanobacillus piezotolerans TaxID=2448030 RepID=A0A498DCE9_9BACI|nr:ABC transporter ATP-binding protein [Oceanobacillus piezotolerans]RLL47912.1 ABC transporter ATP-binding protein [Oceanobacillus piezotolerans]
MLKVESLAKSYRNKVIIDDISFTINKGDIVGLVGENGAGKSTLLSILATLKKPTKGNIFLEDKSFDHSKKAIRREIGYVPQDLALWEEFTVEENMIFFEQLSWVNRNKDELRQLCVDMKLEKWKEPVHSLSGGMKRKLNLAISLIHQPNLLLLDEPTVGIDLKSKTEIGNYLHTLAKKQQKMIIYTSHDMEEIRQLCDYVIVIGKDTFYKEILLKSGKPVLSF